MNLWKSILSVLILVHFGAILAVVLSAGSDERPSYVFMRIREPFTPYLQSFFFESPYRFYAPNPSHDDLLWVRQERPGQPSEWIEWPTDHPDASGPLSKRYTSMTRLALELTSDDTSGKRVLTETSRACFSSIVRGLKRHGSLSGESPDSDAIAEISDDPGGRISVFFVRRRFLTPEKIRAGQLFDDIRLMQVIHVGDYLRDGSRINAAGHSDSSCVVRVLPTSAFLAEVLQYDSDLLAGDESRLPKPVDRFLRAHLYELDSGIRQNPVQSIERLLKRPDDGSPESARRKAPSHSGDTVASQEER